MHDMTMHPSDPGCKSLRPPMILPARVPQETGPILCVSSRHRRRGRGSVSVGARCPLSGYLSSLSLTAHRRADVKGWARGNMPSLNSTFLEKIGVGLRWIMRMDAPAGRNCYRRSPVRRRSGVAKRRVTRRCARRRRPGHFDFRNLLHMTVSCERTYILAHHAFWGYKRLSEARPGPRHAPAEVRRGYLRISSRQPCRRSNASAARLSVCHPIQSL